MSGGIDMEPIRLDGFAELSLSHLNVADLFQAEGKVALPEGVVLVSID